MRNLLPGFAQFISIPVKQTSRFPSLLRRGLRGGAVSWCSLQLVQPPLPPLNKEGSSEFSLLKIPSYLKSCDVQVLGFPSLPSRAFQRASSVRDPAHQISYDNERERGQRGGSYYSTPATLKIFCKTPLMLCFTSLFVKRSTLIPRLSMSPCLLKSDSMRERYR